MIQFNAILKKPVIDDDNSMSMKLETREMNPNEYTEIATMANKEIWVGMSTIKITHLDIPEEVTEFDNEKTPSERLRNVLFVYWKEVLKQKGTFENFRKDYMEKIIINIKEKLPQ